MRASIVAEKAGTPTASIIVTGFMEQAKMIARSQGMANAAIAEYPGVIMTDSAEELKAKVEGILVNNIITGLTHELAFQEHKPSEPAPEEIYFEGTLHEINELYSRKQWTDGLPIIPPTLEAVQEFVKYSGRSPDEVIGILLPENREATVWNIAVNGVMAGCRPEYMPILIAIVEAIAEPDFHLEDAGSTPGWEPLIILNGPIIKDLGFNYEGGVLRVGRQANTSIGRFLRLYMINVAGLRIAPAGTDKGCISATFNVVLAENEDAVNEIGWKSFSVERGFNKDDNVVTVQSVVSSTLPIYTGGDKALEHAKIIAEVFGRTNSYWLYICCNKGQAYPLLVMSPSIAKVIANDGWDKDRLRQFLYKNVEAQAHFIENMGWHGGLSVFNLCNLVERGILPKHYCQSKDPDRMVRVFFKPECINIVVSGDPNRNQSKGYVQNHIQGRPISKKITLPPNP